MTNGFDSHNFFPQQPCLHVVIDTFSKFIWAVPQHNENICAIIASLLQCFAVMGVPSKLKTDNGPAYMVVNLNNFVKNGTLFISLSSLIIHKDKLLLKGHIEL
jgi:hypothetical protein